MPLLSIAENLFLGNERGAKAASSTGARHFSAPSSCLHKVGLREPPTALVDNLGVGKQQLVEIAKALSKDVRLLILDEPTAALSGERQPGAAGPAAGAQGAGHHLDPHQPQAERGAQGRRPHHRAARRHDGIDARRAHRADQRGPDHPRHGRPRHGAPLSRTRQRAPAKSLMEVRNWNVWHPEHAGRQVIRDVEFHRARRRDRRHCRTDGIRAHRTGHEHIRPQLRTQHLGRGADARPADRRLARSTGPSPAVLPM